MERHHLQLLLPQGTRTRKERNIHTTIDLIFATPLIASSVSTCGLAGEDLNHDSDYLPISTVIEANIYTKPAQPRRLWKQLDEKLFLQAVAERIPILQLIEDIGTIDELTAKVATALIEAIELAVPLARIGPRAVPGWTPEVKEAQMEARRLRRRY